MLLLLLHNRGAKGQVRIKAKFYVICGSVQQQFVCPVRGKEQFSCMWHRHRSSHHVWQWYWFSQRSIFTKRLLILAKSFMLACSLCCVYLSPVSLLFFCVYIRQRGGEKKKNSLILKFSQLMCAALCGGCGSGGGVGCPLIRRSVVWPSAPPVCMSQCPSAKNTETQISVRACVCMGESTRGTVDRKCCITPDEQVGTLHGSLCHQCMNVCVNVWMLACVVKRF